MAIKKNVPTPKSTYLRAQSELEAPLHTQYSPEVLFGVVYKVFGSVTPGSSTTLPRSSHGEIAYLLCLGFRLPKD